MKLSIITINYNNAIGVEVTINSVLQQTYHNIEYIIIDGNSSDKSLQTIKRLCQNKTNFSIKIVSEPDTGIYNAMNKGIKLAQGEYILFLNSGDYLFSKNTLFEVFKTPFSEEIVYGHQYNIIDQKLTEEICLDLYYYTFGNMIKAHMPHQSTLIKRSLFERIGEYEEKYTIISDWAFIMKAIFKKDATIKRIPNFISVYDLNGISSNSDKSMQQKERRQFLESEFKWFVKDYDDYNRLRNKWYVKFIHLIRRKI